MPKYQTGKLIMILKYNKKTERQYFLYTNKFIGDATQNIRKN